MSRGRPLKKPATLTLIEVNRQDLALHSLWVPLAAAAERTDRVRTHASRGFPPPWDARYDGRGAAFLGVHTQMVASPDDEQLSVGFPHCWTAVVRRRYQELSAEQVDPTALLVLRLMCEAPVQLLDMAMCHMAATLVLSAQCSVREATRRCYYWMEWALSTRIRNPAYDLGEMALWMWSVRYLRDVRIWERAIYHELGLPFTDGRDDFSAVPLQIWPRTSCEVHRSQLRKEQDLDDIEEERYFYVLKECAPSTATYYLIASMAMVAYSVLRRMCGTREFASLAQVNTLWAFCARRVSADIKIIPFGANDIEARVMMAVGRMPFGADGVQRRQWQLVQAMHCGFEWIRHLERKRDGPRL